MAKEEIRASEGNLEKLKLAQPLPESQEREEERAYVPYIVFIRAGGIVSGHYSS